MTLFEFREYRERVRRTQAKMAEIGVDLLLVASPANQFYLTGYDGWSFYTPQMVVVAADEEDPIWVMDRTVRPVPLPQDVSIYDVHADGESVDISVWPLQVEPGQTRPDIAIILEGPNGVVTVVLAGHALAPMQIHSEAYAEWLGGPIDLDAAGRDREDW